ncbi:MAG: hypothetical protein AB2705_17780 [Candidatus Thiodiazotropha sp.]
MTVTQAFPSIRSSRAELDVDCGMLFQPAAESNTPVMHIAICSFSCIRLKEIALGDDN